MAWLGFFLVKLKTSSVAPPWGTWFRTPHLLKDRKGEKETREKKAQLPAGFEPRTFRSVVGCATAWATTTAITLAHVMQTHYNRTVLWKHPSRLKALICWSQKFMKNFFHEKLWKTISCFFPGTKLKLMVDEEASVVGFKLCRNISIRTIPITLFTQYTFTLYWN